jgi:hypothetical protein
VFPALVEAWEKLTAAPALPASKGFRRQFCSRSDIMAAPEGVLALRRV